MSLELRYVDSLQKAHTVCHQAVVLRLGKISVAPAMRDRLTCFIHVRAQRDEHPTDTPHGYDAPYLYLYPVWEQSIAISVSVYVSIYLFARTFHEHVQT